VRLLGNSSSVDRACPDATLQCAATHRFKVVTSHVNFIALHEPSDLQVQAVNLAHAVRIHTHSGNKSLRISVVVLQVSAVSRYSCHVMQSARCVEFQETIRLQMQTFAVVLAEQDEGLVQRVRVSCVAEREMWQVVCVNLRLVGTSAHHPIAIGRDANAGRGFLELEVLEQLDAVGIFGILLQTPLALTRKPLW
jgi:hypothetical protein